MSWETFTSMPKDLQKEYVEKICKRFGANYSHIAAMLCLDFATLTKTIGYHRTDQTADTFDEVGFINWVNT
jgi:hypothetical protein